MSDNFGNPGGADARALFGRREMLQRTGFVVGAAALWATPVVQTIGMRPAAATDLTGELGLCEDGPSGGNDQKPRSLVFRLDNVDNESYVRACTAEQLENFKNPADKYRGEQAHPTVDDPSCAAEGAFDATVRFDGKSFNLNFTDRFSAGGPFSASDVNYQICLADKSLSGVLHVSCSQSLCLGDKFGPLVLVGAVLNNGDVLGDTV